jgi:ankyrin repeat protein
MTLYFNKLSQVVVSLLLMLLFLESCYKDANVILAPCNKEQEVSVTPAIQEQSIDSYTTKPVVASNNIIAPNGLAINELSITTPNNAPVATSDQISKVQPRSYRGITGLAHQYKASITSPFPHFSIVVSQGPTAARQSTNKEVSNNSQVARLLKDQVCIVKGKYTIKFGEVKNGKLQALIEEQEPNGYIESLLNVEIAPSLRCSASEVKKPFWQEKYIHLNKDYVYVGQSGLLGGMENESEEEESEEEEEEEEEEMDWEEQKKLQNQRAWYQWKSSEGKETWNIDQIEALLNSEVDINTKDSLGNPLLHLVIRQIGKTLNNYLLEIRFPINISNIDKLENDKLTYLALKNIKNHFVEEGIRTVTQLLTLGVNVNTTDNVGNTPLHLAAINSYLEMPRLVELLRERGANVKAKNNLYYTPLHFAASKGYLNIAKLLVELGAGIHATNIDDNTPLHLAAQARSLEVVRFLLENRAEVNATNNYGFTALHYAAELKCLDIVKLLIERSAKVEIRTEDGYTPLHAAAEAGSLDIVSLLIKHGANVKSILINQINVARGEDAAKNITALHLAANRGRLQVAKFLLENGANVNARDFKNCTPLHFAASKGDLDMVKLLVENKADVNAANNYSATPIYFAAIDIDRERFSSVTNSSLTSAAVINHSEVINFLIEQGATIAENVLLSEEKKQWIDEMVKKAQIH